MLAEDTYLPSRRSCVIKQLRPVNNNPDLYHHVQEQFRREAAILEDLSANTPQIPKLYAYFEEGGRFYLVQELIEGQTVEKQLQTGGPLGERAVIDLLVNSLLILQSVHAKGIIHRDVKPANLMVRAENQQVVLIDFGAVKETMVNQAGTANLTVIGTPGYMPLEQKQGNPVFASDLYSLGVTALVLLTGRPPQELWTSGESISWDSLGVKISPLLARVLDQATRPEAGERFASAEAMLQGMGDLHVDLLADQLLRYRRPSKS